MTTVERERRRALKDQYVREHGGALTRNERMIEDATRRARLRGAMPSLGFALSMAGVMETHRTYPVDAGFLIESVITGDVLRWHWFWLVEPRHAPAFPAPVRKA